MKSTWLAGTVVAFVITGAQAQTAPMTSASDAMPMPASGAKAMKKKPMRARVTGGPGYVSESAAPASGTTMAAPKPRATVTGGPGGTAGTPSTK